MKRRHFLLGAAATSFLAQHRRAAAFSGPVHGLLKIDAVELVELHGTYTAERGVDAQPQVNPLDVYDELRPAPYADKPAGERQVATSAIYVRIRTAGGIDGLYGPIEKSAATVGYQGLRPFLGGKDAPGGRAVLDQMYRSNRHSRDGFFMMGIS